MNEDFARTIHGLEGERRLSTIGLLSVGLIFVAWVVWLFVARISVFEMTREGRIGADRGSFPIEARVDGRVRAVTVVVGQKVAAGEILVQLETEELEIRLGDEEARYAALEAELTAAREELDIGQRTLAENQRTREATGEASKSQLHEAEIEADFATREAERAVVLHDEGQLSRVEMERLASEADRLRATVESRRLASERDTSALRSLDLNDRTDLAQLRGRTARLEGESRNAVAQSDEIRVQIEKRAVRAPRDGKIGELSELTVAALVTEGELLGTVLAAGELEIIAELAPASALGRVRKGQSAQMRLDGFPWTQYGLLTATVKEVAATPRDGKLRVELTVDNASTSRLPVRHGLTGTVEIEVERLSPASLLLRTLGKTIDPRPVAP
jgi:multidrug resistance efflux pump